MSIINDNSSSQSSGGGGSNASGIMGGISSIGGTLNDTWDQYYKFFKDYGIIPDRQLEEQKRQFDAQLALEREKTRAGQYDNSRNRQAGGFDALAQMRMGAKKDYYGNY